MSSYFNQTYHRLTTGTQQHNRYD